MYRIKLASGEETVYRSVEELALGINSGMITSEAQVYHKKTDTWVPIVKHPDYQTALTQAPLPARPSSAWEQLSEAELSDLPRATPPAVEMPIPSEERSSVPWQNRKWILAGVVVAVIAALGIGYLAVAHGKPKTGSSQGPVRVNPSAKPSTQTPTGITPGNASIALPGGPAAPPASTIAQPSVDSSRGPGTDSHTPEALGQRYSAAYQGLWSDLNAGLARTGASGLFSESRLSSADSVTASRRAIAGVTKLLNTYRSRARKIEQAYRDSSQAFRKSGAWNPSQAGVWDARALRSEPPDSAKAADSLLVHADQLLSLLSDQSGKYSQAGGLISFEDASAGDRYEAIRGWFESHLKVSPDAAAGPTPLPIEAIRSEFLGSSLPGLVPKAPDSPVASDSSH